MPRQSVAKTNVETNVETNATPDLRDKMDIRATAKCTGKCDETIPDEYQKCQSAALIAVAGNGKLSFVSFHAGTHHHMRSATRQRFHPGSHAVGDNNEHS